MWNVCYCFKKASQEPVILALWPTSDFDPQGISKNYDITNLKIFKHYKLKPSFSTIKHEKAKDKVGGGGSPQVSTI